MRRTTTTKKKKRRAASAFEEERPRSRRAPEPPAQQWTTSHVAIALVVGLGVGGIGGYYGGQGDPPKDAAKDQGQQAPAGTQQAQAPAQQATRPQPPPQPTGPVYVAVAEHSPRKGPLHAKVTVLEFSDFQ
jgi:protein-disulfide isomerase